MKIKYTLENKKIRRECLATTPETKRLWDFAFHGKEPPEGEEIKMEDIKKEFGL